jgi:hypothetical protein
MRSEDFHRIAFVTKRFHELQGLPAAVYGAGLMLGATILGYLPREFATASPSQAGNLAIMAFSGGLGIHHLYRCSYGEVRPPEWRVLSGPVVSLLVLLGYTIDTFLHLQHVQTGPTLAAVGLGLGSIWILARDWAWRPHYLIGLAAAAIAVAITATAPGASPSAFRVDPVRGEVMTFAFLIIGFGLVTTGLLDHALLVRAMPKPGERPIRGKGAVLAMLGGVCIATSLMGKAIRSGDAVWLIAAGLVVAAAIVPILQMWVWYSSDRRPIRLPTTVSEISMPMLIATAAVLDYVFAGSRLPNLVALSAGAWSLWVAMHRWPSRAYFLVGAASGFYCAVTYLRIASQADRSEWLMWMLFLTGLSLFIEGALDFYRAQRVETLNADTV